VLFLPDLGKEMKTILFAVFVALLMVGCGEEKRGPQKESIKTIEQVIDIAKQGQIEEATIQSNPKGGEEWYVIEGSCTDQSDGNQRSEHFRVDGRVTESEYKELRQHLGGNLREVSSSSFETDLLFGLLPFLLVTLSVFGFGLYSYFWIKGLVGCIKRQPAESKTAWVVVLVFLPVLGTLLYFIVGRNSEVSTGHTAGQSNGRIE
jgi:hypothetical protein